MDRKGSQRGSSEERKTGFSPTEEISRLWSSIRSAGGEDRRTLRADLERARSEYNRGDYDRATATLRELLTRAEPDPLLHAAACALLGLADERQGCNEQAHSGFERAVEIFDQQLPYSKERVHRYYGEYGISLYKVRRGEEAIEYLHRALSAGDALPETNRYLGLALKEQGEYEQAEAQLKKALEQMPGDALARRALLEIFEVQGRSQEAHIEFLEVAISLLSSSRLEEAYGVLSYGLDLNPDNPSVLAIYGELLRVLGRHEEALGALDRAYALDPGNSFLLRTRGETLRVLGRHEEALEALERALSLEPENTFALGIKGGALYGLERYEEALETGVNPFFRTVPIVNF